MSKEFKLTQAHMNLTAVGAAVLRDLMDSQGKDYSLVPCLVNGAPSVLLCHERQTDDGGFIAPLFVMVADNMVLTGDNGTIVIHRDENGQIIRSGVQPGAELVH